MTAKKYLTIVSKPHFKQRSPKASSNSRSHKQKADLARRVMGCVVNFYEVI